MTPLAHPLRVKSCSTELSAQQVASYLMDYEDHFTSHEYRNLYWTSFEAFINKQDPSPECYQQQGMTHINDETNLDNDNVDSENFDQNIHMSDVTNFNIDENDESDESDETILQDFSDEIGVSAPSANELVAKSSQVMDYQLHPTIFNNVCVWDFITSLDKKKMPTRKKRKKKNLNPDENCESDYSDDHFERLKRH